MKNIILTSILVVSFIFVTQAQKKKSHLQTSEFTVDQRTNLALKKMTLSLDLSDSQQKKLYPILLSNADNRQKVMDERKENIEKKKNISSDQLYDKMIAEMDYKIKYQGFVKKILNDEQYEKWHKNQSKTQKKHAMKNNSPKKRGPKNKSSNS